MNLGDESRFWPEGAFPDAVDPQWEAISAYVDGELDPAARRAVEVWLEHDPEARCVHAQFCQVRRHLEQMPVPRQREDLAAQVLQRAQRENRTALLWRTFQTATIATVAWMGWQLWPRPVELALVSLEEPPVEIAVMPEKSRTTQQAATYLLANKAEPDALAILLREL